MDNKDFKKLETSKETQDNSSNIDAKSKPDAPTQPLSQRKKVLLALVFLIGIALSYPTVLPFSIIFSGILLFQENKKATIAGFILVSYQIIWVLLLAPSLG
jgi:thiol:disulfide interchange protein